MFRIISTASLFVASANALHMYSPSAKTNAHGGFQVKSQRVMAETKPNNNNSNNKKHTHPTHAARPRPRPRAHVRLHKQVPKPAAKNARAGLKKPMQKKKKVSSSKARRAQKNVRVAQKQSLNKTHHKHAKNATGTTSVFEALVPRSARFVASHSSLVQPQRKPVTVLSALAPRGIRAALDETDTSSLVETPKSAPVSVFAALVPKSMRAVFDQPTSFVETKKTPVTVFSALVPKGLRGAVVETASGLVQSKTAPVTVFNALAPRGIRKAAEPKPSPSFFADWL